MESFKEIVKGEAPVLVDFHATWCGPCQTMHPVIDDLKNDFGGNLRIIKIDVDKNQALAQKYKIRGVPSFILFKEGEIVWRGSGIMPKSEMVSTINQSLRKFDNA